MECGLGIHDVCRFSTVNVLPNSSSSTTTFICSQWNSQAASSTSLTSCSCQLAWKNAWRMTSGATGPPLVTGGQPSASCAAPGWHLQLWRRNGDWVCWMCSTCGLLLHPPMQLHYAFHHIHPLHLLAGAGGLCMPPRHLGGHINTRVELLGVTVGLVGLASGVVGGAALAVTPTFCRTSQGNR